MRPHRCEARELARKVGVIGLGGGGGFSGFHGPWAGKVTFYVRHLTLCARG